jgi:hypothetical protein
MAIGALAAMAVFALPAHAVTFKHNRDFADIQTSNSDAWSSENPDYVQQSQAELDSLQDVPVGYTDISDLVGVGEEIGGLQPYPDDAVLAPHQVVTSMQATALVIEDFSSLEEDADVPPTTVE